ncbi:MAG: hypothetical protein ISR77_06660 [Pirellulaceae bacterium]|nr:hypothetical protein [Pirellulaceae bacterium]
MRLSLLWIPLLMLTSSVLAEDRTEPVLSNHPDLFPPDRVCPATSSRKPLLYYRGKAFAEVQEGYRLIVDSDSHPRRPARLKSPPSVKKCEGGYEIAFALDGYDDVDVSVVDASGTVVRRLGCGVLGPNAPMPFAKHSLAQTVVWDGLDEQGNSARTDCRVLINVGLQPRFKGFVGYDRASTVPHIVALEVDPKGRVYVATSAENRSDPVIVRFDRNGTYLDMVYPPSPRRLTGRKLEDVYRHAEYIDGRAVPTRARSWSQYIYQWPAGTMLPFRIDADGKGYIAEILTGHGAADVDWKTTKYRIFCIDDMDNFWFLQNITLLQSYGGFALDGKGFGYLAAKTSGLAKGAFSTDPKGIGRIRKVRLDTGEPQLDFTWNGTQKCPAPSAYLGTALEKTPDRKAKVPPRTVDKPEMDSENRFVDIKDIEIDAKGRLLVVDSRPRRVKVYEANGRFIGILDRLTVDGAERRFKEIVAIEAADDDIYLIASFQTPPAQPDAASAAGGSNADQKQITSSAGPLCLVKCAGDIFTSEVVWQTEVHPAVQYLAVDRNSDPRLIWLGNGNGPGTFSRLVDKGVEPGAITHFGGTKERCFRFPVSISADGEGRLYVYDHVAGSIVRTDGTTTEWKETRLRSSGSASANQKEPTLFVDRVGRRLYATHHGGKPSCYTLDLEPVKDFALRGADGKGSFAWGARSGGTIGGVDRQGNIYASDGVAPKKKPKLNGVVRRFGKDGRMRDQPLARLTWGCGSLALDSRGNMYVLDLASADLWTHVSHNIPCGLAREIKSVSGGRGPARLMFKRGAYPVWQQSDLCYLVKFGPEGGERNTATEQWSHRGFSPHTGSGCSCDWPRGIVAVDAADRIYAADAVHHHVKVLDTAGNLVARIGWWGSAEDVPEDGDATKLGFWNIYGLAATGERLYVSDKDLRRIAGFVMAYRQTVQVPLTD